MEEIFKKVPGYNGRYWVSNLGRVKSTFGGKDHIIRQRIDKNGYKLVDLYWNKKRTTFYVHRLVAIFFLTKDKEEYNIVDHINNKCTDNRACNLRWTDVRGNTDNRFYYKLKPLTGENIKRIHEILNTLDIREFPSSEEYYQKVVNIYYNYE